MTTTITITAGADSGPLFEIYGNSTGSFILLQTGVAKATLIAGYTTTVPNGTTSIRVKSLGSCTNYDDTLVSLLPVTPNYIITNGSVSASSNPPNSYNETYNSSETIIEVFVTTTFQAKLVVYTGATDGRSFGGACVGGSNLVTSGPDVFSTPVTLTPGVYNCGILGVRAEGSSSIPHSAGYSVIEAI